MKLIHFASIGSAMGVGLFDWFQWPSTPNNSKIWGQWSRWSDCNKEGERVREAPCVGGLPDCQFPLVEKTRNGCALKIWGAWGSYSDCDSTTGKRSREAPCLAGAPHCYGPLKESQDCASPPTKIWGSWSAWSICASQTKKRTRSAPCIAGMPQCQFPLIERQDCQPVPTPPLRIWGSWSAWTACTQKKRSRTAPCLAGAPHCLNPLVEEQACAPVVPVVPISTCTLPSTVSGDWNVRKYTILTSYSKLCSIKPQIFGNNSQAACSMGSIRSLNNCLVKNTVFHCRRFSGLYVDRCFDGWLAKASKK